MSAEYPEYFHSNSREAPGELCSFDKEWILKDYIQNSARTAKRVKRNLENMSFMQPTTIGITWYDQRCGVTPGNCPAKVKDSIKRRLFVGALYQFTVFYTEGYKI